MPTPKRARASAEEARLTRVEEIFADGARRFGWYWLTANRAAIRVLHELGMEPESNRLIGGLIALEIGRAHTIGINEVCDELDALLKRQPNNVHGAKLYDELQAMLVKLKESAQ